MRERCTRALYYFRYPVLLFGLLLSKANAQNFQDTLLRLSGAIQMAEQRFPLLRAKRLEVQASIKNTDVVKYSRLPTVEASYQANISTANILIGQYYPEGILSMSGPPSLSNYYSPATGSA